MIALTISRCSFSGSSCIRYQLRIAIHAYEAKITAHFSWEEGWLEKNFDNVSREVWNDFCSKNDYDNLPKHITNARNSFRVALTPDRKAKYIISSIQKFAKEPHYESPSELDPLSSRLSFDCRRASGIWETCWPGKSLESQSYIFIDNVCYKYLIQFRWIWIEDYFWSKCFMAPWATESKLCSPVWILKLTAQESETCFHWRKRLSIRTYSSLKLFFEKIIVYGR
jgi:hypothetical protein